MVSVLWTSFFTYLLFLLVVDVIMMSLWYFVCYWLSCHEDKILIRNLWDAKRYGSRKVMKEFLQKGWKWRGLDKLLKKIREAGSAERQVGSGRPRTSRTQDNINTVEDLIVSQEDKPQFHCSTRQIARKTCIHRATISRIVHKDLGPKCLKWRRAHELLNSLQTIVASVSNTDNDFIWFIDDRCFL